MSAITIESWGHSAVRLTRDEGRLAIDPGILSDPAVLEVADAVLVTHEHPDHFAAAALAAALQNDGELVVWGPESVVRQLVEAGAPSERVHAAAVGQQFAAAGFRIRALGGDHAVVHPALPGVANNAYLVEEAVLHPGDSFVPVPEGVEVRVLLLPISAPWLKVAEAVDYVNQVQPQVAVPIHDAVLSDAGRQLTDRIVGSLSGDVEYRRLGRGEPLAVG